MPKLIAMLKSFAQKDFEAAVLQHESAAPIYSRLVVFSSLINPGLNIDGQGTIKFPVPMQNLIPSSSSRPKPGPEDGNQWEMQSKYVMFDNPNWETFLRDLVSSHYTTEGSVQEHAVELEFRKLVLFDSCSSNFPQVYFEDGDDNSGVSLVFLPSKSPLDAAAVAGIDCNAYRLALYYKITSPTLNVNFTDALYAEDNLRRVLVKWNKGKYPSEDDDYLSTPYVFYCLSRNYDLDNGKPILADEDRKMASFIHRIAEELDFILCLGHYCHSNDSTVRNNGFISHIIDMDGDHVIGNQTLWPPLSNCIGQKAGVGDQPIGEAVLDNPVSHSVIVLFRAKAMYDIAFSQNTIEEMFQGLVSTSNCPANKVKRMALHIIDLLKGDKFVFGVDVLASIIEFSLSILDLELWKEAVNVSLTDAYYDLLWNKQTVLLQSLQVFGFEPVRSSFECILDTALFGNLYTFLRDIPSNLAIGDDADAINLWCDDRLTFGLRRFGMDKNNIPHLMDMAHSHGIHYLLETCRTRHDDVPFLFVDELIRTLQKKKSDILASNTNVHFDPIRATAILKGQGFKLSVLSSEHVIDILVDRWLGEVIGDFLARLRKNRIYFDHYSDLNGEYFDFPSWRKTQEDLIPESLKLIKLCIVAGHVERCGTILDAIDELGGNRRTKLQFCLVPLVYRLGPLVQEMHTDISSPPFAPFFQRAIERYVLYFLGTRKRNPQEMFLRQKINCRFYCSCKTCTEVKKFLHQLYIPRRYLSGSEASMYHLECNTVILYELADIKLVHRPRIALQITKKQQIFGMQRWENRVKNLLELLRCIGSDDIIERVMGDRYSDLKLAMEGKEEFREIRDEREGYETRGGRAERRRRMRDGNREENERGNERKARNRRG